MTSSLPSVASFFGLCAQVIPALIIAILLDPSRGFATLSRQEVLTEAGAKLRARQSRRVILAIFTGGIAELYSLYNVINIPPFPVDSFVVNWYGLFALALALAAIAYLLYVLIIPHLELHIAMMFSQREQRAAWYRWAWFCNAGIALLGLGLFFVSSSSVEYSKDPFRIDYLVAYALWGLALFGGGILSSAFLAKRLGKTSNIEES